MKLKDIFYRLFFSFSPFWGVTLRALPFYSKKSRTKKQLFLVPAK